MTTSISSGSHYEYILLNVDKSEYTYNFNPNNPLILKKNPKIGLKSLFLWYTIPNIGEKYENDTVRIFKDNSWQDVKIPEGMYELDAISKYLNDQFRENEQDSKIYMRLDVNKSTFKCIVKLSPNCKIDFSVGKLHELLGLEKKIYDKISEDGPNFINITRGLDRIMIRCNLVDRQFQHELKDVLYDVLPYAEPGSAIQENLDHIEFFHCKDNIIRSIQIRLTDKSGNSFILSETMSIKIIFKHDD